MPLTFEEYIAVSDELLAQVALYVYEMIEAKKYAKYIQVLDDHTELSLLSKGYYLRFLNLGNETFHLYGIEVLNDHSVIVHENIKRSILNDHKDLIFRDQLKALNKEGRILYREAKENGGGIELHRDLAEHYALHGVVGLYVNQKISSAQNFPTSMDQFSVIESKEEKGAVIPIKKRDNINTLILALGLFTASVGVAAVVVVGALVVASLISFIAPPIGIALLVGGGVALAAGVGMVFFGSKGSREGSSSKVSQDSPNTSP